MKKILIALALLLSINAVAYNKVPTNDIVVNVVFKKIKHLGSYPTTPRKPAMPITASQSGHIFTFPDHLAGETIEFVSGDTVVYTSVISEDGTVTAPDDLTGEYTLVLYIGDEVYSAEVKV